MCRTNSGLSSAKYPSSRSFAIAKRASRTIFPKSSPTQDVQETWHARVLPLPTSVQTVLEPGDRVAIRSCRASFELSVEVQPEHQSIVVVIASDTVLGNLSVKEEAQSEIQERYRR
jgi:hypothetical protein